MWPLQRGLLPLVLFTVVSGLGFGFFQTPNNRNMLLSAPRERSGAAGGMQATARLVGQTAGAVVMALLFTLAPSGAAPRIGLGVGAALALAGGLVSTLRSAVRRRSAGRARWSVRPAASRLVGVLGGSVLPERGWCQNLEAAPSPACRL